MPGKKRGINTVAVHGTANDAREVDAVSPAVERATTFRASTADEHARLYHEGSDRFYYRFGNPNSRQAARAVADLEGSADALVFSSGMGAIATALMSSLKSGDHVVAQDGIFDQTARFLVHMQEAWGIGVTWVDPSDLSAVAEGITDRTKIIYVESPSNPMLNIAPLRALADHAMRAGAELWVDGTFASPVVQRPLVHGASLVLHSGTKYLGGHSDVMCGVAAGSHELIARVRAMQILVGTVLAPDAAWLLMRGLRTIGIRVPRQSATALLVAQMLHRHPGVADVRYPYLPSSPGYDTAVNQMSAGGGVVTFRLKGDRALATRFVERLQVISIATSLGGVESTVELPFDLDFVDEGASRAAWVRLSIGIEDVDDLLSDLEQALT